MRSDPSAPPHLFALASSVRLPCIAVPGRCEAAGAMPETGPLRLVRAEEAISQPDRRRSAAAPCPAAQLPAHPPQERQLATAASASTSTRWCSPTGGPRPPAAPRPDPVVEGTASPRCCGLSESAQRRRIAPAVMQRAGGFESPRNCSAAKDTISPAPPGLVARQAARVHADRRSHGGTSTDGSIRGAG